jgi:hypothetical protein
VKTSKIRELQGFAAGIERDKAAVVAGLTLPSPNVCKNGMLSEFRREG